MKIMKESIANLERCIENDKVDTVGSMPIVMADAFYQSQKNDKKLEDAMEETDDIPEPEKVVGAEKQPIPKKPEEPKVTLEEGLFEDYNENFIITKVGENKYALAKGTPPIINSRINIEAESPEEAKEILMKYGYKDSELIVDESLEESYDTPSRDKVAKFIEDSKEELLASEDEGGCCRLVLDDDLCLYVGWESGFDEDNGHDGWEVCAKIAERNDYDWADFEFLNMPWYPNDGEVWDTSISNPDASDADWFIKSYEGIRDALDNNEIVLESLKKSRSKRLVELEEGKNSKPFVDQEGNVYTDEDRSGGLDSSKDLWTIIYNELAPEHSNWRKRTKIKDIPTSKRYDYNDIEFDYDDNILIHADNEEDFELARRVADAYGLEFRNPRKRAYDVDLVGTIVMPKNK